MYFLAGRGTFVTEDREIPLEPGVCIYNPPGKTHKIINTGDEVLRFVWIYSPRWRVTENKKSANQRSRSG